MGDGVIDARDLSKLVAFSRSSRVCGDDSLKDCSVSHHEKTRYRNAYGIDGSCARLFVFVASTGAFSSLRGGLSLAFVGSTGAWVTPSASDSVVCGADGSSISDMSSVISGGRGSTISNDGKGQEGTYTNKELCLLSENTRSSIRSVICK